MKRLASSDVVSVLVNENRFVSNCGALLVLAMTVNTGACATVETRQGASSTKVVGRSSVVEPGDAVEPSVAQEGSEITIKVKRVCRTREMLRIQTTTTFEKYDASEPTAATTELRVAGVLGLLGGLTMATSKPLANSLAHDNGGTSASPTPYLVAGGVGLAAGAVFLIAAAVDAAQSSGTEDRVSISTRQGGLKGVAKCPTMTTDLPPTQASLQFGGQTYPVGQTDPKGTLEVDLAEALPPETLQHASLQTAATVVVGFEGRPFVAGQQVSLEPILFVHERKAWATLDRTTCLSAASITACDAVQDFAKGYPNGAHVADARAVLEQAEPKLRVLRDAEALRVAKEQHDAEIRVAKERGLREKQRAEQEAVAGRVDRCGHADSFWASIGFSVTVSTAPRALLLRSVKAGDFGCEGELSDAACYQMRRSPFQTMADHFFCHRSDLDVVRFVTPWGLKEFRR